MSDVNPATVAFMKVLLRCATGLVNGFRTWLRDRHGVTTD